MESNLAKYWMANYFWIKNILSDKRQVAFYLFICKIFGMLSNVIMTIKSFLRTSHKKFWLVKRIMCKVGRYNLEYDCDGCMETSSLLGLYYSSGYGSTSVSLTIEKIKYFNIWYPFGKPD